MPPIKSIWSKFLKNLFIIVPSIGKKILLEIKRNAKQRLKKELVLNKKMTNCDYE